MTRIDCVPVTELVDAHLRSNYREMLRVRHAHPLKNKSPLPPIYRMGTGHVRFFYDKGKWLLDRHMELRAEMVRRDMFPAFSLDLSHWPSWAMNDWEPDDNALRVCRGRIAERLKEMKNVKA